MFGTGCVRLRVYFLAFEVSSGNFCSSFLVFSAFFMWYIFLLVLDHPLWVYVDHASSCFSLGIALFIAFPILAFTLYPIS